MDLKTKINNDLKQAMLARDKFKTTTLQGLKAAILNEEVAQGKRESGLKDAEIEVLLAREVKKRKEAAALLDAERAENELQEAEILSVYLPEMLSEDKIRTEVKAVIATLETKSPQAMGQVIGRLKAKLGTTADGATLAKIVKEELN